MQLPSLLFLFYCLPLMLILYFGLSFSRRLQNLTLMLGGLLIYAWGRPSLVWPLLLSIIVNRALGAWAEAAARARPDRAEGSPALNPGRAGVLAAAALFNFGLLFLSKYLGFAAGTINYLLHLNLPETSSPAPLPLGLSLFSLHAFSYVADLCRTPHSQLDQRPQGLVELGLYLTFFPVQAAGPVLRFAEFAPQLRDRKSAWSLLAEGSQKFAAGMGKYVLLAWPLGQASDLVFNLSGLGAAYNVPSSLALFGLAAFGLHFYFFLSGCADMAVGLGLIFGFKLPENFNRPYTALSLTDFWRRWNITAVDWFNQYLFMPLRKRREEVKGGPADFLYGRDMILAWLLFGLWCGPGWTFVAWGGLQGFILLFERIALFPQWKGPVIFKRLYLLTIVSLGWVVFRADNVDSAVNYLKNLFALNNNGFASDLAWFCLKEYYVYFLAAVIFCLPVLPNRQTEPGAGRALPGAVIGWLKPIFLAAVYLLSLIYLVHAGAQNPTGF